MPFVAAPAPAKQSTGGGGFRAAGAFLAAEPPKWKPDVLAALPKRTVGWLGETGLPVVGEYQGDDVVLYPAPTDDDPSHKLFLRAPKSAKPPGPNAWPYEKRAAEAERGKPRPGGAVDVLDRDAKTGAYREAGLLFAGGRREIPDVAASSPTPPRSEIDDFVRRRETLELLKGRDPEKFSRAMQLYERYAAYRDGSPTLAKPIGERALKLFQEIMPEGDYERWLSERKLVERGDWNPPQVVWKDRGKKSLTLKPSETRGRWSGEVGIPVEELLQAEDAAARQTAAGEEVSDNALARFGQRGALGLRRLSQGLNRVLNPFVSDETLDEVGRTTDALSAAAAARSGPVGRALGQAAESLGTMAGGAAAGAALGPAALPAAMAAAAGTSSYDQAYREATEAGLRGGERTEYALQQAGWETVPSLVFSHVLKIPGVEGILSRSAVNSRTLGRVLKDVALQAGISGAEEVPEEVVTAIGQNLTAKFSGVDPARGVLTPDELVDVVAQSFITAGLLTGVRNAPAIARSAFGAAADPEAAPQQPGAPVGGAPPTPPAAAATADTTDFIPTDLGDATNVGGLAQASPQVKWSQGVSPQQVQPADGGGKTAELPLAALAGDTAGAGATPTPDPLRRLAPVPQGTAAVAAWAKENPEAAARVLAATKEGAPLTREQMATLRLGLKSGGADARAAFVKTLSELPPPEQGTTDAAEAAPPQAEVPSPQPAATPPEAPQAVKPPPPPPVLETAARDALRKYAVESGLSEKLLPMDTEYQRLKALADAERRSNLAKEGVVTKRAKLAEREQAQRDVAAGKVDRENVQYAPLHEVEPELRNRIQAEAVRLLGETDSANTRKALEKIIQDAGADTGAAVEKQKERIVGILTGEVDQRTVWEKKFVAPRPADPVVQLLLIPQGDRGVILRAAQRSVVDGKPDGLALWAKDLAETELNAGGTLDDPFVPAGEDQILAKLGELADVVGASLPEGDVDFEFGGESIDAEPEAFGIDSLRKAFNLDDQQAEAVSALAGAIGLDVDRIAVAARGTPAVGALEQAAYHGSPHTFDKFTTAKMGTGEGAQAYGWGLYFAGKRAVAEWYRDKLSSNASVRELRDAIELAFDQEFPDDQEFSESRDMFTDDQWPVVEALRANDWLGFDYPMQSVKAAFQNIDAFDPTPELREAVEAFKKKTFGKLYEVDLKPEEDEYLLWDKPLSEQSEKVKSLLAPARVDRFDLNPEHGTDAETGETAYERIAGTFADERAGRGTDSPSWTSFTNTINDRVQDQRAASEFLKSLGIRGIKYLDGSSRSKGDGSYNYVIFDDSDVEIKNVLYQGRKGAAEFSEDGKSIIRGFEAADVSTGVHEIAHVARRQLLNRTVAPENRAGVSDEDIKTAEDWAGAIDGEWSREAEEKFARGFERYLAEGKAPSDSLKGLFAKLADWLRSIYATLTGSDIDVEISEPMQKVFDRLVTRADRLRNANPFTLKRESADRPAAFKFDNSEGEQRRMFSGMDALPGQEDLFEGLDKPAEAGQGMRSEESRRGPNPFRRITPKASAEAQTATETRSERSAGPNPFRRQPPRAKRATRSEESTRSEASSGSTGRQYGQGREASAAGKLGPGVLKPLPMPELIQLARELLGKLPQIRKRMGDALGRFQYRPGSRLFDILIQADVPQSEQDVAEVLAHELGHLIDYLPDNALTRGNILGRIASLRGYLKDYLAATEGGPGPLTADDEKRLRDEAKRLLSTTAEEEVDEEIRTTTPITPADVLAIWNAQDTSGLDPGLLTYIKRATAAEKKSIILQAMKGIVPADLQKFAKEIVTKTGKKIKRAVPGKTSAADVAAKLKELIAEEIRKRQLLSAQTVRDEVMAVSEWWRPFDRDKASADDIKYRESSKELYADALSVLLNSPGELEARAPEFWRGFTAYADKKPEFLKAYLELQSILAGDDATVAARRRENIQAMFDSGDEQIRASATAARAARLSVIETVKQFFGQYLLNRNAPLNVRAAKAKREGVAVRTAENAEYMLDEFFRADNANHVFLTDVQAQVHRPLLDAGLSRDDLGEYLFLKRVLNERHEIANPLGFNPTESAKQLADLKQRLGKERFAALEAAAAKFHDLAYDVAAAATVAGYYSARTFNDVVKPNRKNYAAFAVVKYLEDTVSPAIKEQVGTFEDIANPFDATVMKIMAVNRMIELNKAKVAARDLLLRAFPQDIAATPIAYKQREPSKPAPDGMEYLYVFEDGKPAAYAVPKEIAAAFRSHDVGGLVGIFNVIQSAVYKVFHPLYVTLSPGFQAANPFKDLRRTLVNLPAAAKAKNVKVTMREILAEYVKAIPTSYRRAAGIDDAVLREMMETKALDTPFAEMDLEATDKGQYERLLEKHGITDAEAKSRIGRVLQAMGNLVSGVGIFQETLTKVAAFNLLKKKGLGDKETSYIVRKYVGTPDYKQRGLATAVTNSLWMYSKVKWNGLQADLRLAGNPTTAAGWWWRAMLSNVLPTWTYRLALAGAFGPTVAAMFQRIPKYFLDNYDVIPLGFVGGGDDEEEPDALSRALGKVAFFTIPKDETGRLLSALASSMFDVAQEMIGKRSKSGGAQAAAGEAVRELQAAVLPDLNPLLDIAWKWLQFGAGVNPVDHTGRAIVPRDEWTAGGWDASKMLLTWTSDKFGVVSDLMKWAGRDKVLPSRFRGADGGELNAPWYTEIPGLSRLIRVSDYGLREDEWTEIENEEQERARFRIGLGETIRGATSERYALSRRSTLGALDDPEALRLFHLNSWYAHTYLPLTDEIRELEADGGDGAELRKKLDDDTALATAKQPPADAAARTDYLRVHGQSIGSLLLDATSPRPEREDREKGDAFAERKKNYQERRDGAARLIDLLDLTPAEKQRLLKEEAKRRGYQTNRWEGEYKNRRTAFGVREAKLNAL